MERRAVRSNVGRGIQRRSCCLFLGAGRTRQLISGLSRPGRICESPAINTGIRGNSSPLKVDSCHGFHIIQSNPAILLRNTTLRLGMPIRNEGAHCLLMEEVVGGTEPINNPGFNLWNVHRFDRLSTCGTSGGWIPCIAVERISFMMQSMYWLRR